VHDGIELDRRGVPVAVICTDQFVVSASAQATICGSPDYPFVVVGHPIGSLTVAELRARAAAALPQVLAILTGGATAGGGG
jgi:hypothetical protein